MLIEAFCKYKINTIQSKYSISNVKFINYDDPLTEDIHIAHSGLKIPFFANKILVFQSDSNSSNVFKIEFSSREEISFNHTTPTDSFIYDIQTFESIYPCTGISIVFNENSFECILFEFAVNKRREQIINGLKKMKSDLYEYNGILYSTPIKTSPYVSKYVIKADDGDIFIDFALLKRENLTGLYFNNNLDVSSMGNNENNNNLDVSSMGNNENNNNLDVSSMGNNENNNNFDVSYIRNNENNNLDVSSMGNNENNNNLDVSSIGNNEDTSVYNNMESSIEKIIVDIKNLNLNTIFEYFNNKSYLVLIKSFINEFNYSKFSFIKHCILDSLYFVFIKIENEITVIVSKKLYNFIPLYNMINSDTPIDKILNIPDLNPYTNLGYVRLIMDNQLCNFKYNIPDFDCEKQIDLIFKYSYVMLEETHTTFWFIAKVHDILFPMRFPGLILSPLIKNMEYLLDGPYPFLISSNRVIELKDRPVFTCETPGWSSIKKTHGMSKNISNKSKASRRWTGKLKKHILTKFNYKTPQKLENESFLLKKNEFTRNILCNKKNKENILSSFEASSLIERCFLNESRHIPIQYSFDLVKNTIEFDSYSHINITDAVSLWLILYKGPVNLTKLFNKRWINLEFLCRRACIDGSVSIVNRILNKIGHNSRMNYKGGIVVLARRRFLRWYAKPFNTNVIHVLQSLNMNNRLYDVTLDTNIKIDINVNKGKYATIVTYQNETFKLVKLEHIIACLESNYMNSQIRGSIIAYLQYFNLSLNVPEQQDVFKGGFKIYI